jgi:hypothetical protein
MPYKGNNYDIVMKKVLQFRVLPIEVSLPGDTLWGGVYDGQSFLPGSGQFEIAKHCSQALDSNHRNNQEWASIAGCFFNRTPKGQHRPESRFTGGASLEPLFYPSSTRWNFLPKKNIVYIPNPSVQMTVQQISMYRKAAATFETPVGMDSLTHGTPCESMYGDGESENTAPAPGEAICGDGESENTKNKFKANIDESEISESNVGDFSNPGIIWCSFPLVCIHLGVSYPKCS